jgi:hypothetical protein
VKTHLYWKDEDRETDEENNGILYGGALILKDSSGEHLICKLELFYAYAYIIWPMNGFVSWKLDPEQRVSLIEDEEKRTEACILALYNHLISKVLSSEENFKVLEKMVPFVQGGEFFSSKELLMFCKPLVSLLSNEDKGLLLVHLDEALEKS